MRLLALLAEQAETAAELTPVAIETSRGLLVACLQGSGRDLYVIKPTAAARYRERTTVAPSKSDAIDALIPVGAAGAPEQRQALGRGPVLRRVPSQEIRPVGVR